MNDRFFDSQRADALSVHRMAYQDGCGAIHAIGNGEIMLYGRGPEWMQVFGAPYSCPTVFSLIVPEGDAVQCQSRRHAGAGSWIHKLNRGTLVDCASRSYHCIARHWDLQQPMRFELDCHDFPLVDQRALFSGDALAWLITIPANAPVYNDYPLSRRTYMMIYAEGGCHVTPTERGLMLTLENSGALYITGAQGYQECVEQMRAACGIPFNEILADADSEDAAYWQQCAQRCTPLRDHPLKSRVLKAAEDVAFLIRAQQHCEGGVQAGHNYHLAYVRDQYGVARGLLAMGDWEAAKAILQFYRGIFEGWGFIANAQGMGLDGVFHVHENDRTEITGYLLLQALDLVEVTGDEKFFHSLCPMLNWALQAQLDCLHNDMLPFNGDETYIAGHIISRTLLNHGSFEATLMLITAGRRYIGQMTRQGLRESWMDAALLRLDAAADHFEHNFRRGKNYVANSLYRRDGLQEPEFRHGVCYNEDHFGWLHREAEGCYLCPQCIGQRPLSVCHQEYVLKSVLLMVSFIRADQIAPDYLKEQIEAFLQEYRATGHLPSRPNGELCLGYDFGLMLFAAADAGSNADDVLVHMLSLQDACGAWSEYYSGITPRQTRCRPWESAINIAGALRYLSQDKASE